MELLVAHSRPCRWPASLVLALAGRALPRAAAAAVGVGSVGARRPRWRAAGRRRTFLGLRRPARASFTQTLWTWMRVGGFRAGIALLPRRAVAGDDRWW